jgi:flagellar biosynthesis GTPase FlhF
MKKTIMMLVVLACSVLAALTGVLYAKNIEDIQTNWKTFYHDDNVILSYGYINETGVNSQDAKLYVYDNSNGYIYILVKKEATEAAKKQKRWQPAPGEDYFHWLEDFEFKMSIYMVFLDKIDCNEEVLSEGKAYQVISSKQPSEVHLPGETYDQRPETYKKPYNPHYNLPHNLIKLDKQSPYSGLPFRAACKSFSKTWKEEEEQENKDELVRQELAREKAIAEKAIAEKATAEKARLEKQEAEQATAKEAEAKRQVDEQKKQLKQYGVQYIVSPITIEADPFRFEGKVIATKLQFERMMSATTASFTSGYGHVAGMTNVVDQIIVSGIPRDTHFVVTVWGGGVYKLILRGKGTTIGTNAFGAKISVPHFQYVGIIKK